MDTPTITEAYARLEVALPEWEMPFVEAMGDAGESPFRILIATILSLRTRDTITTVVSRRLFAVADTPETMLALPATELEALIKPVNFYQNKSANIHKICRILLDKYDGRVPDDLEELLTLPGVGRKTANLVITAGYNQLGICVDTHVHRITNRFGYVKTTNPDATEMALREKLPVSLWRITNRLLVAHGQNICHPTSPYCSRCPVNDLCERVGVIRSR